MKVQFNENIFISAYFASNFFWSITTINVYIKYNVCVFLNLTIQ